MARSFDTNIRYFLMRRLVSASLFVPMVLAGAHGAYANFKVDQDHSLPKTQVKEKAPISNKDPVVLTADQVDYDQDHDVVYASGHVEVVQGETVVIADHILYDRAKDTVQAMGNVSMLEPSGNVYFGDTVDFQREMKTGVIQNFKARLSDDSVAVASHGNKINEYVTNLTHVAYTPCKCLDDKGQPRTPFWTITSDKAKIDKQENEMIYRDAYLNLGGEVPIMYTPYLSHSLPGAENESGLMIPTILRSRNLGEEYWQPVYYTIAPDKDITLTPVFTTKAGEVIASDYRQKFDNGFMDLKGSITSAPNFDAAGNHAPGHEVRGHVDANGEFKVGENYDWGFNVKRATDDTYMRIYHFGNDSLLTSRVYGEGFNVVGDESRSYASAEGLSFQGLTGQDNAKLIPVVAPLLNFNWQSSPDRYLYFDNSRLGFDANSMVLYRDTGAQSRRISGTMKWDAPYVSDDGQVVETELLFRTDLYDVDKVQLENGDTYNGVTGREVPQGSVTWHYPFINTLEDASVMVEPVVNVTVSSNGGNPEKIPNEDSGLPDFTDANLFSSERFAGYDRVESGARTSYGIRAQAQVFNDKYIDGVIGQQYRANNDPNFPITNDLNSHVSDYVGRIGLTYSPFNIAYRFRLDKDNLYSNRNEIDAGYNLLPVNLNFSYLSLKKDPVLPNRETITGNGSLRLDENWSLIMAGSRDLLLDQTVSVSSGVVYKNECTTLTTMVVKDYTSIADVRPALSFLFKVSLKNLD